MLFVVVVSERGNACHPSMAALVDGVGLSGGRWCGRRPMGVCVSWWCSPDVLMCLPCRSDAVWVW